MFIVDQNWMLTNVSAMTSFEQKVIDQIRALVWCPSILQHGLDGSKLEASSPGKEVSIANKQPLQFHAMAEHDNSNFHTPRRKETHSNGLCDTS